MDLAVIGAGTAGCALAAALRLRGWSGSIALLEIGRGPGGRTATRRSRSDPSFALNHGAPLFNISASPEPKLLEPLRQGGWSMSLQTEPGSQSPDSIGSAIYFVDEYGLDTFAATLIDGKNFTPNQVAWQVQNDDTWPATGIIWCCASEDRAGIKKPARKSGLCK